MRRIEELGGQVLAPPVAQRTETVAVLGVGYIGLPLVVAFGRHGPAIGFDIDAGRIQACRSGVDPSDELGVQEMSSAVFARYTTDATALRQADVMIIAVPTPVDAARRPDLGPLLTACRTVGAQLRQGGLVIIESTVYPGVTEELCIPELEAATPGLRAGRDFAVAYSPERINPGDPQHSLSGVVKVVGADSPQTVERVAALYLSIGVPAVHRCSSIRVAEACKAIENTQRDLNIALMNELAVIFGLSGLNTAEVLEAARTKWNFADFRPGLVGGHCISVDPYYLLHHAEQLGYHPQVILAGRRINDGMGKYVAEQLTKRMAGAGRSVAGSTVHVLGLTFKEDCADLRNSKVRDIVGELHALGARVCLHDPRADADAVTSIYGCAPHAWDDLPRADAAVVAVAHREYRELSAQRLSSVLSPGACVADVKSILDRHGLQSRGHDVWSL